MRVNCGRCHTEFVVPGPGEFQCPACGTANRVGAGAPPPGPVAPAPAAPPLIEDAPSPRVRCSGCDFEFIVGDIAVAPCPNCGADVPVQT